MVSWNVIIEYKKMRWHPYAMVGKYSRFLEEKGELLFHSTVNIIRFLVLVAQVYTTTHRLY